LDGEGRGGEGRGGDGTRKKEEGKREGRREAHPRFSQTPHSFICPEISLHEGIHRSFDALLDQENTLHYGGRKTLQRV
jgi:hypothetical protein